MLNFKKFFLTFFLIILSSCGIQKNENNLLVGVSADNPPYEFIQNNNIIGLEIDIINEIGKKLNKELIVKNLEFNGLLAALESKNVDLIIAGLSVTEDRKNKVSFSKTYFTTPVAMLYRYNDNISSLNDLKGKTIGYQLGTVWGNVVESLKESLELESHSLSNNLMLIEELKSKIIDAVILEENQAKKFTANNSDFSYIVLDDKYSQSFAIAFPLNSELLPKIDEAIKELEEEGKLKVIINKWLQ